MKMYKNDIFLKEYTSKDSTYKDLKNAPIVVDDFIGDQMKTNEGFGERQNQIVKEAMNYIAVYGMNNIPAKIKMRLAEAMAVYRMKFEDAYMLFGKYIGNWGQATPKFIFEGYKDGKLVKTVIKAPFEKLYIHAVTSSGKLAETDTYDVASVRITVTDEHGNIQPFFGEGLPLEIEGQGEIIGPTNAYIAGGMGGTYVRTCGRGTIKLTIKCPEGYEDVFGESEKTIIMEVT